MNPDMPLHHRRSIRLKGYDYSQAGAYFVTIVTQGRAPLLGEVVGGVARLSPAGEMVAKWWDELENKFPGVELGAFVVMPNHIHGIINIIESIVGVDLRGDPETGGHAGPPRRDPAVGVDLRGDPETGGHDDWGKHAGLPLPAASLSTIIQWYKTMTTNAYIRGVKQSGWPPFAGRFWQRNYYEHIIRNQGEHDRIHRYIEANPLNWGEDRENLERTA